MNERPSKIIILDRDGVINADNVNYIKCAAEWLPLQGSIEAICTLCQHGYSVYVATNQSGIGRGLFSLEDYQAINDKMIKTVNAAGGKIAGVFYCPHTPDDKCECRKPKRGLFTQIAAHAGQSIDGVPAIGDSRRDLEASAAAGCRPILIRTGNGSNTEAGLLKAALQSAGNIPVFDDLAAAAASLIAAEAQP
jgi:D-glycero-D-manno-heptose 1,7-bisphosphate phosphatase